MKAVVLEIKNEYAAVLRTDGTMEKIRNAGYSVGQEIELKPRSLVYRPVFRNIAAAAALFVLLIGMGIGYRRNGKECAYVTVDVNPSLEYALNAKSKVLRVSALNADAEAIVASLNAEGICGRKLDTVLASTKVALMESGYLGEEKDNTMLISVVSNNVKQRDELKTAVETVAASEDVDVYVVEATISERKEAMEKGVSTGRYEATKQAATEPENAEKIEKGSVKELVESSEISKVVVTPTVTANATETPVPSETTASATQADPQPTKKPTKKPEATAAPTEGGDQEGTEGTDEPAENPEATPTPGVTSAPVATPTAAARATATPTPGEDKATATPTPSATSTPTPTSEPTNTPTPTPAPADGPGDTTPTPTPAPDDGPVMTPTPIPTVTPVPEPTAAPTEVPTATPEATPADSNPGTEESD
ncbi:MAG: hypothetical protein IK115_07895 [Lachnospiraceae bacterium]|nr:hypothetical protein [Lachnospiraceae bacterium]